MKTSAITVTSFASALCLIWLDVPPTHAALPHLKQLPGADSGSIVLAQDKGGDDKKGKMMTPGAAPGMQPGSMMMDKGDKGGGDKKGGGKKGSVMAPGMQPGSTMMDKGDKGGKGGGEKKGKLMTPGTGMQQRMGPGSAGQMPQAPGQMGR